MFSKSPFLLQIIAGALITSIGFAGTPAIGIITASGHFTLEGSDTSGNARSETWGNATLFDGTTVETKSASSELALRNGVKLQLAASSRAKVWENRVLLEKGVGQIAGPASYEIEAGGLKIRGGNQNARLRVGLNDRIEVASLAGTARVVSRTGLLLAAIPAGRSMSFSMQAADGGSVTRSGCLLYKDGHFLLQDENTAEVSELSGPNLAQNVGNRVEATGTVSSVKPAVTIATLSLTVTSLVAKSEGGCLSAASALDAKTEVPEGSGVAGIAAVGAAAGAATAAGVGAGAGAAGGAAAGAAAGLSTGAIVGIVAGGGAAAAGAGIALAGKKSSSSP